jgi:site-specific recombinase XerD
MVASSDSTTSCPPNPPQPITVVEVIELFLAHRRRKNVAQQTLTLYTWVTRDWRQWREASGLSPLLVDVQIEDIRGFLGSIDVNEHPHNAASHRRILRALWRFVEAERLLTPEQALFFANGRIPRPITPEDEARPFCDGDKLAELVAACGEPDTELNARNRAIILLLAESGMRVAELCSLTDEKVDLSLRQASILGKGRKRATVFWGPVAAEALQRYLSMRKGKRGGPLFRNIGNKAPGAGITTNTVRCMFRRLGVELPKGAPIHFIRHGFAHRSLDNGLDISQVQQLMRHTDPKTTMRYLRERTDRLRELHKRALGLVPNPRKKGTENA